MGKKIADVDLIDEIQRLAGELGRTPIQAEMNDQGAYSHQVYRDRFGSWSAAVEAAGHYPNPHGGSNPIPDEKLLDELRRLADELGRTPTSREMKEDGEYGYKTYYRHFGSWNAAIEAAGLEPVQEGRKIPTDDLLDELLRLRDELDRTPTVRDMNQQGRYSAATYRDRFDSWNSALEEIGAETQEWKGSPHGEPSNDELLDLLQTLAIGLKRPPEPEDAATHTDLDPDIYRERWGSWWVACSMAGVTQADLEGVFDATADAEEAEGES